MGRITSEWSSVLTADMINVYRESGGLKKRWMRLSTLATLLSSTLTYIVGYACTNNTQVVTVAGPTAITVKNGVVILVGSSALAATTLADPVATTDDGKILTVVCATAYAHTLTIAGGLNGAGAASDVGTFGAAAGNYQRLVAYNGKWYSAGSLNITYA